MTLDVPAEFEEIIRNAVASGAFASPEDAVRHALRLLEQEQHTTREGCDQSQSGSELEVLHDDLDPSAVAAMQGVGAINDPDAGAADTWPENESIDDWLADLRRLRGQGTAWEPK